MECSKCGFDLGSMGLSDSKRFCPECGSSITSQAGSLSAEVLDSERQRIELAQARGICPQCRSSDQVQNVGTVIDSEKRSQAGLGAGIGIGGVGVGIGKSGGTSKLGERLQPPPPKSLGCMSAIFLGLVAGQLIGLVAGILTRSEDVYGVVGGIATFIVVPLLWFWLAQRPGATKRWDDYAESVRRMRSAYYCWRDDLVFDAELSGNPLAVKKHFFGRIW